MYIRFFLLFITVNLLTANREFVIRKDYFRFLKPAEYTVYDDVEQQVFYRLESEYSFVHSIKLIAYPSKEEIGQLRSQVNLISYRGNFSIVDPRTNERRNGSIERQLKFGSSLHHLQWNGKIIHLESKAFSLTTEYRDVNNGELLAQFRLRPASVFVTKKYDMKIYSNKYPDAFYLFGFVGSEGARRKN